MILSGDRQEKKKEEWVGEKGRHALHYSKSHECQIKEEQESNSVPLNSAAFSELLIPQGQTLLNSSDASNYPELPSDAG